MSQTSRPEGGKVNRLLSYSLRHPVVVMCALFIIAYLIKVLDVHILRLDELLGEAILTKGLGFGLVVAYVYLCGRKLRDIGFHTQALGRALLIAGACFAGLYVVAYTVQVVLLRLGGEAAGLTLTAVDPKTGMTGGLGFGLWLFLANFVNSAMEEGLFRGAMVRHFRIKFSPWGAILLQAGLFAVWHLNWPLRMLLDGTASPGQAAFEALGLLVGTGISGIVYGYLYLKTDNLWAPFLGHTINNSVLNFVFIRTASGVQPATDLGVFLAIFLAGHLLLILLIRLLAKRLNMPEVRRWGAVEQRMGRCNV